MDRAVDATNLGAVMGDMSIPGLFLQADIVVKIVIVALLLASVWVWAIVFEKAAALRRAGRAADGFEDRFWSGGSLDELYEDEGAKPAHPMAAVFGAAMSEWRRSLRASGADLRASFVRERVDRAMNVTIQREMERLERWMVFLASVGSSATFVGLFGTVWGIMHTFTAISTAKNTSLVTVGPGIAEALFATAIGLVAAIPATRAYTLIGTSLTRFAGRLEGFGTEFGAILSRQTEERS